jgi:hypothetical protein
MKKLILLILSAVFLVSAGSGKTVDAERAKIVAANYLASMPARFPQGIPDGLTLCYTSAENNTSDMKASAAPLFYVFNVNGLHGFIIISADDIIPPVLAYSYETSFTADDIPPNVATWLKGYEDQIGYAIRSNLDPAPEVQLEWTTLSDGPRRVNALKSATGVGPLVTTLWSQRPFYNDLCPYDSTYNDRAVSGCVATAMAMVMKYHNYPPNGIGSYYYYSARYGTLSANFGAATYQWADMPNTLSSANTAVSTLMYHCGVGVKMDYNVGSQGGSNAWVIAAERAECAENALKNYFGYASTLQGLTKSDYTDSQWISILKTELDAGRPMVYAGYGSDGGHCFVCDGYNDSTYFHFNWGWAGNCNGYFLLNNLNPHLDWDFTGKQQAITGIQPPDPSGGGNRFYNLALNATVTCPSDTIHYQDSLSFHTDIINNGPVTFSGDISACIYDTNGIFIREVQTIREVTLLPGSHFPNGVTFTNPGLSSVFPNTYFVGIMYSQGDSNRIIVHDTNAFHNDKRLVVINANPVEMYTAMSISPGLRIQQGDSVSVDLGIVNHGTTAMNGTLDLSMYDVGGNYVNSINGITNFTLPVNEHTAGLTFSAQSINVEPGCYFITLRYQPTGSTGWQLIGSAAYANPVMIRVNAVPLVADQYEPNDTSMTASPLPVSFETNPAIVKTEGANCHTGTDYDFYTLSFPPGFTYVITGNLIDYYTDPTHTYTLDAQWSSSTNGTTWSENYTDTLPVIILNNGGTILFQVSPYYVGETGTYQAVIQISRNPLGVNDQMQTDGFRVYPNPASNFLTIETSAVQTPGQLSIVNLDGRQLITFQITQTKTQCNISSLRGGVYFVRLTNEKAVWTGKFVKL